MKAHQAIKSLFANKENETLFWQNHKVIINRHAYKRSIQIYLYPNGTIFVEAPYRSQYSSILEILDKNRRWLEKRLLQFERLRAVYPHKKIVDGELFPFLGDLYSLKIQEVGIKSPFIFIHQAQLICHIPLDWKRAIEPNDIQNEILSVIKNFYKEQALLLLNKRAHYYSEILKLYPKKIQIRGQKTRWGSCSSTGTMTLNWKLIVAPREIIDYVIVHELFHFQHPNHSLMFWKQVEGILPNYRECKQWLKKNHFTFDFLNDVSELWC